MRRQSFMLVLMGGLVILDVRAQAVVAPPISGAAGMSSRSFTLADLKAQFPQSKEGDFMIEVPEIFFTAGDKEVQRVLAGQPVETTAQVSNADGKRLRVFRQLTQCCASDARSYSIAVELAGNAPVLKALSWVKLVGTVSYKQEDGKTVPFFVAIKITPIEQPEQPILK